MKSGRITSLKDGPKRDVEVRIASTELFSAISVPPGAIVATDVAGYEVAEDRNAGAYSFRLFLRLVSGSRILFYNGVTQIDLALLLDEFEAALPNATRSRAEA